MPGRPPLFFGAAWLFNSMRNEAPQEWDLVSQLKEER